MFAPMKSIIICLVLTLSAVSVASAQSERIRRIEIPCPLSNEALVDSAARIFARTGCRLVSAFPIFGTITGEFIGDEGGFYSPTTFHLALAGGTLYVTVYCVITIGGGQIMYREPDADVVNPVLSEVRRLAGASGTPTSTSR